MGYDDRWKTRPFEPGSTIERVLGVDRYGTHRSGVPIERVPREPVERTNPPIMIPWPPSDDEPAQGAEPTTPEQE